MKLRIGTRPGKGKTAPKWQLVNISLEELDTLRWALGEAIDGNHVSDLENDPPDVASARKLLAVVEGPYPT